MTDPKSSTRPETGLGSGNLHRAGSLRRSSELHDVSSGTSSSMNDEQESPEQQNGFGTDLEKGPSEQINTGARARGTSGTRVSRIQSVTNRRAYDDRFTHPLSHQKTAEDVIVDFEGPDDPYHPLNWPFRKKAITTALYGFTTMGATLSSTIYSPMVPIISQDYQVGEEVSLLGISFTLAGFGLGPMLWGPISEMFGRKPAVFLPYFIGAMFAFACGSSKDIQSILITRFFLGLFSSAPVSNTGGALSDIWAPTQRAAAIVFYAFAVVGGPVMGPVIAGAFVVSGVDWRWTQFLSGIYMTVVWFLGVLVLDESYPPILLTHKAKRLRIKTGNWALHASFEEWDPSIREMIMKFGVRPLQMLLTPICFLIAIYASFVYGLLYGNLAAFPIIFEQERGWSPLIGSLPFLGLLVGMVAASGVNILNQKFYIAKFKANGNKAVPEARLPPMMVGSVAFAAGCFVLAWTADRNISAVGPIFGTVMLGFGFFTIFQSALNYLIDTFKSYSASAVAANTFLRSIMGLAFPLFITPMYAKLGINWGTSVFGFFSVLLIPVPYLFYKHGAQIRKRGKYTANMD